MSEERIIEINLAIQTLRRWKELTNNKNISLNEAFLLLNNLYEFSHSLHGVTMESAVKELSN
jgi:hypothetical protein